MFKTLKIKVFLLISMLFINTNLYAQPIVFNNLTILVSSCDKYSSLWDPFFVSLFKEWPSLMQENRNVPIFLIANSKKFSNPRVKTINIPHEISWSDNMISAVDQVETKYVMIALDDYWLNAPVNEQRLLEIYTEMQKEDAAMLQVSLNDDRWQQGVKHPSVPGLLYSDKFKHFKASLQLAIWDKEALKCLLRPGESAWDFELSGTARSHGYPKTFLNLSQDNEPISYINAAKQGYVNQFAITFAQQNQIPFNPGELPVLEKNTYKIFYKLWKGRINKFFTILKNPNAYFATYYPYQVETLKK